MVTRIAAPEAARQLFELASRGAAEEIGQGVLYLMREVGPSSVIEGFRAAVLERGDLVPSSAAEISMIVPQLMRLAPTKSKP